MKAEDRFNTLSNFTGWGNPHNSIWFVGIEEGGDWSCCSFYDNRDPNIDNITIDEYYKNFYEKDANGIISEDYSPDEDGNIYYKDKDFKIPLRDSRTLLNISKLCYKLGLYDSSIVVNDPKEYLHKILCRPFDSINPFLTNLYPIAVKGIDENKWEKLIPDYKNLFKINFNSKHDYRKNSLPKRIEILSKLYKETKVGKPILKTKQRVIISYGYDKQYDKDHLELLKAIKNDENINFDNDWKPLGTMSFIKKEFDDLLFLLVPHFRFDMSDKLEELGILNELRNALK